MNILVWFTGVISQYKVGDYSIPQLKLNISLYNKLKGDSQLFFIICVKDDFEKKEYVKLLENNRMKDCHLLFMPYGLHFTEMMSEIISHVHKIDMYVDYSKSRLNWAHQLSNTLKLVHLSELID